MDNFFFIVVFLLFGYLQATNLNGDDNLMVAFKCGWPNMKKDGNKWKIMEDLPAKRCASSPHDALTLCLKAYPHSNVENVIEAEIVEFIHPWCRQNNATCGSKDNNKNNNIPVVFPFKCLTSDSFKKSLPIPEGCSEDLIFNEDICLSPAEWKIQSEKFCMRKGSSLSHHLLLSPCKVQYFFRSKLVCCPGNSESKLPLETNNTPINNNNNNNEISNESDSSSDDEDEEEEEEFSEDEDDDEEEEEEETKVKNEDDVIDEYSKEKNNKQETEHDRFVVAKQQISDIHQSKRKNLLAHYKEAVRRASRVPEDDKKQKLLSEINQKFEDLSDEEERLKVEELNDLDTIHQRRLNLIFSKKYIKRNSIIRKLLEQDHPRTLKIAESTQRLLKLIEKEKLKRFARTKHLIEENPEKKWFLRRLFEDMLVELNKKQEKSFSLFHSNPQLLRRALTVFESYWRMLQGLDSELLNQIEIFCKEIGQMDEEQKMNKQGEKEGSESEDEDEKQEEDQKEKKNVFNNNNNFEKNNNNNNMDPSKKKEYEDEKNKNESLTKERNSSDDEEEDEDEKEKQKSNRESSDNDEEDEDEEEEDEEENNAMNTIISKDLNKKEKVEKKNEEEKEEEEENDEDEDDDNDDDEDDEDENENVYHFENFSPDNMKKEKVYLDEPQPFSKRSSPNFSLAIPLGIAVGTLTVIVVIVVGVLIMRRRGNHFYSSDLPTGTNKLDIDGLQSAEEKHVAEMQYNGYENPTYKYFERYSQSNA